jgi:sulfonate transport system ATP-binding protein
LVAELWKQHNPAILLVTHDVEEALLLADRVVIMRNGKLVQDATVDLPRPRRVSSTGFVEWRSTLLSWLGVEST